MHRIQEFKSYNIYRLTGNAVFDPDASLRGRTIEKSTMHLPKEERSRVRSRTFIGIANAMADQWGSLI